MLWEACVGLFEEIRKKSDKYISIDFAVECLALREGSLYKAVMVLLHYKVDEAIPCYMQDEYFSFTDIDNDKTSEYSAFEILKDIKKEAESNGGIESKIIDISDSLKSKISKYYWERDLFLSFEPIEKSFEFEVVVLTKDDEFIDGFNDDLQGTEIEKNTDASNIELQQLKLENENLKAELAEKDQENEELKQQLKNMEDENLNLAIDMKVAGHTLDRKAAENENLKAELAEKDQKIKELESLNPKNDMDLLSLIFDESATERYAPDLALSIKLWEHIYITNPKSDSHTNKAIKWLESNTGYEVSKKAGSASKIREITTPFVSWGNLRDKNYKK